MIHGGLNVNLKSQNNTLEFNQCCLSTKKLVALQDPAQLWQHENLQEIRKIGSMLCKNNTEKLKGLKNVTFITTYIKNVTKTNVAGSVIATDTKKIIC